MHIHKISDAVGSGCTKGEAADGVYDIAAETKDIAQLNHLMRQSKGWWGYDQGFLDGFMEIMGITSAYLKKSSTFVALEDSQVIGFYSFTKKDDQFELDNFFIRPELIGTGKGRKMWSLCVARLADHGARDFILWSDPGAESFYLKMGCVRAGERQSPLMPNRFPPILKYTMP